MCGFVYIFFLRFRRYDKKVEKGTQLDKFGTHKGGRSSSKVLLKAQNMCVEKKTHGTSNTYTISSLLLLLRLKKCNTYKQKLQ
jgi:hypothetical protein